jgi:RIO kinase 1
MSRDFEDIARREEMNKVDWRRIKRKKGDEVLETVEEVFDKKTVMALYQMINKGIISGMLGVVKAGKESRIYWAKGASGESLAVKIFLTSSMEFKKSMLQYIQGDPRFKVGRDYRKIVYTWARKEFRNLTDAYNSGVPVPRPIYVYENVVVMEFIGLDGIPSPLLKELPKGEITYKIYNDIINALDVLYRKAALIHADLSEYNVIVHGNSIFIIDFGQAVIREHPMAEQFLRRDVGNIIRFFVRAGIDVPTEEEVLKWLKRQ